MTPRPPAALLALATAHQRAAVLFALTELGVFDLLTAATTPAELAAGAGTEPPAMRALLEAGVAIGLLAREGDRYRNTPDAARYLVRTAPDYLGDVVLRHARASRAPAWTALATRLRAWRPGGVCDQLADGASFDPELAGQHALALAAGDALADALDLGSRSRLADLGGGTGAMAIALCRRHPELHAIVVEQPAAATRAAAFVRSSGLDGRIDVTEGDVVRGPLPAGCDAALLANVLSLFDEHVARGLLGRVREALAPHGTIVLSGWMRDPDGDDALAALLGVEDLALGAPDVERSSATYAAWLADAGFADVRSLRYFPPFAAVTGTT